MHLLHTSGVKNGNFNGRTKNWMKVKRTKAKVVKRRKGTVEKHRQTAVKSVSGVRTGKHKKKVERKQRREAAGNSTRDEEMADAKGSRTNLDTNKKKKQDAMHLP